MERNNIAWRLYGAGLEMLRRDEVAVPEPGENEILIRIDAVGLCFSDIKIIRAGASHPKLWWQNLDEHPLIPGHEVACTVVRAGAKVPPEFSRPGSRYLIQCDIYIKGRSCAFGYGMDGAYVQYGIIDELNLNLISLSPIGVVFMNMRELTKGSSTYLSPPGVFFSTTCMG